MATIAANGKKRAKVLQIGTITNMEHEAKEAYERTRVLMVENHRKLREALKAKHEGESKERIKEMEASLIKRAAAENDKLSLSQDTVCSIDTIGTISTIDECARAVAYFSKERKVLLAKLKDYKEQLDSMARKGGKDYESDATERTATPKKRRHRRRAVSTDTDADVDSDE